MRSRHGLLVCLVLAALCAALPQRAHAIGEVSGRIGGFVFIEDTHDGLAGVTLTIRSKQLIGGSQTATTADDGSYIFQNLPPGTYELSAKIEGFTPVLLKNITVNAGQQSAVDIPLHIGTPAENQTYKIVERVNPVLNPESASAVTTVDNEKAQKTPIFHQVQAIASLTPGTGPGNSPSVRGGLSRYTRFLVDGLDTTDITAGGLTSPMNFEAVEQFVILAGAMDAEYNSLGLVQNMVTRSGGNKFSVDAMATIQPTFFAATTTYTLPAPVPDQQLLYDNRPQTQRVFYAGAVNVGGPIVKDRLWFYTSFQFNYNRQTTPLLGVPWYPGLHDAYNRFTDTYTYLGRAKLTWQATASTRIALSFNLDRNYITNAGVNASPFVDPTRVAPEAERRIDRGGEWVVLLWDSLLTPKLLFQLQTGFTYKGATEDTQYRIDGTPNHLQPAHTLFSSDQWNGFSYLNSPNGWNNETKWRFQFDPSLLYTFRGAGEHNMKAGVQVAYMRYDHNVGTAGGANYTDNETLRPDGTIIPCDPGNPATFAACNQVRLYPSSQPMNGMPGAGWTTTAEAVNVGVYIQDRWTIGKWFTIVPGMRVDVGTMYDYQRNNVATLVGYGPRLSAIYDLLHDRSTLIEAHYGRHNDVGNAFIADRGNPFQVSTLQQWNPATNSFATRSMSGGPGGQTFAQDVTPPKVDEVAAGIHREVIEQTVVGIDYTFRSYRNLWVNQEVNQIWDPAGLRVIGYVNGMRQQIFQASTPDEAQRTYHGVDFWVKGTPGHWDVLASYTLSFVNGTVASDYFEGGGYGSNPRFNSLFNGPLSDNYRHNIKGAVDYHFNFGLDVGVHFQFLSGAELWKVFQSPEDRSFSVYKSPRGTDTGTRPNDPTTWATFQLPDQFTLDVEGRYSLEKLTHQRIDLVVQLFNLLNNAPVTREDNRAGVTFGYATGRLSNFLCEVLVRYRY